MIKVLNGRIDFLILSFFRDIFQLPNRTLCKREHGDVFVILVIPSTLLSNFKKLVYQIRLVLVLGGFLLVIIATIS